ncbi:MAG: type II toxin-antitoxin system HicB family antitoxin [Gammaproteobacteria bacterium]|nr:type II toxin-antitoxin system HicB family antitoxin [Gammaproteobacteria bacterium]
MKFYYALFKKTDFGVEVEFPDLPACVTFGKNWEEAIENASDVLAAWLANAEKAFIKEPSSYESLQGLKEVLVPITVDERVLHRACPKNVVFRR